MGTAVVNSGQWTLDTTFEDKWDLAYLNGANIVGQGVPASAEKAASRDKNGAPPSSEENSFNDGTRKLQTADVVRLGRCSCN